MIWIGFIASLVTILVLSQKSLPLGLVCGAVVLGIFTLPAATIVDRVIHTITDPSILLLTLAMGIIPIIGGTTKASGQVDSLVNNLRIPRRYLLAVSAAMMGLLPMPGGALLSAPILEQGGQGVDNVLKSAVNNWFRHLFILIYPLCPALIVSAQIAELDVYRAILYILPGFFLALALGYIFFLRKIDGKATYTDGFSWKGLLVPLAIILTAPILDFSLKRLFGFGNLATVIGVSVGLALSIALSARRLDLKEIITRMKPWNFALIIVGMFLYLHIFQVSGTGQAIGAIPLPPLILAITGGFALGFSTGRVQLPASIIFPVYIATAASVTPLLFALIYTAIYFGYIMSPVHPCLVVTCEYFGVPIKTMMARLAVPTFIIFAAVFIASLFLL